MYDLNWKFCTRHSRSFTTKLSSSQRTEYKGQPALYRFIQWKSIMAAIFTQTHCHLFTFSSACQTAPHSELSGVCECVCESVCLSLCVCLLAYVKIRSKHSNITTIHNFTLYYEPPATAQRGRCEVCSTNCIATLLTYRVYCENLHHQVCETTSVKRKRDWAGASERASERASVRERDNEQNFIRFTYRRIVGILYRERANEQAIQCCWKRIEIIKTGEQTMKSYFSIVTHKPNPTKTEIIKTFKRTTTNTLTHSLTRIQPMQDAHKTRWYVCIRIQFQRHS